MQVLPQKPLDRTTYWIGKDDHMIRKIVERTEGTDQIEVITIVPAPNARIERDLRPWNAPPFKALNTDADCRASSVCKDDGKCHGDGSGDCKVVSDADCRASTNCATFGLCTKAPLGCVAGSAADCKQSDTCKKWKRCRLNRGICTDYAIRYGTTGRVV